MPDTETTEPKQNDRYRGLKPFKPGQSGNPAGRAKGSRNALGEDFVAALAEDFAVNGRAAITAVRVDKPDQYLKVIAQVVPKEVHHRVEDLDDLSDDAIEAKLIELLTARAEAGSDKAGGRTAKAARAERSKAALPN